MTSSKEHYQNLHIVAKMRTPIISDEWLPLDGVLHYHVNREQYGPIIRTLPGGETPRHETVARVPLWRFHDRTPRWYYACSFAWPRPWWQAEGVEYWNKRLDVSLVRLIDRAGRRGRINTKSGAYKGYHMPVFYRAALEAHWYCRGLQGEIKAILSVVTHLGKKRSQGWGQVAEWLVEPWPHDWSVYGPHGELMRSVPPEDVRPGTAHVLGLYGLRPSYYERQNQSEAAMPII